MSATSLREFGADDNKDIVFIWVRRIALTIYRSITTSGHILAGRQDYHII